MPDFSQVEGGARNLCVPANWMRLTENAFMTLFLLCSIMLFHDRLRLNLYM